MAIRYKVTGVNAGDPIEIPENEVTILDRANTGAFKEDLSQSELMVILKYVFQGAVFIPRSREMGPHPYQKEILAISKGELTMPGLT